MKILKLVKRFKEHCRTNTLRKFTVPFRGFREAPFLFGDFGCAFGWIRWMKIAGDYAAYRVPKRSRNIIPSEAQKCCSIVPRGIKSR